MPIPLGIGHLNSSFDGEKTQYILLFFLLENGNRVGSNTFQATAIYLHMYLQLYACHKASNLHIYFASLRIINNVKTALRLEEIGSLHFYYMCACVRISA